MKKEISEGRENARNKSKSLLSEIVLEALTAICSEHDEEKYFSPNTVYKKVRYKSLPNVDGHDPGRIIPRQVAIALDSLHEEDKVARVEIDSGTTPCFYRVKNSE